MPRKTDVDTAGLLELLEEIFPKAFALSWDRVGLQCGSRRRRVRRVAVALDPDPATVSRAIEMRADLLLTHHPLSLGHRPAPPPGSPFARARALAIRRRLPVIAMHTNADFAPGGLCDLMAGRFKLRGTKPLVIEEGLPVGRIGTLPRALPPRDFARLVARLWRSRPRFCGTSPRRIRRVAVCSGSGSDLLRIAVDRKADALVTGDVKYHAARDAEDHARSAGFLLVDAGHWATEIDFVGLVVGILASRRPELEIMPILFEDPFRDTPR